jgi:hypothetical protein
MLMTKTTKTSASFLSHQIAALTHFEFGRKILEVLNFFSTLFSLLRFTTLLDSTTIPQA